MSVLVLEEAGPSSEDDESTDTTLWRRNPNLNIRSTSMPQFQKNKWLGVFMDLVQGDLNKVNWTVNVTDLSLDERLVLK